MGSTSVSGGNREGVRAKKQKEFGNAAPDATRLRATGRVAASYSTSPKMIAQRAELDEQFGASRAPADPAMNVQAGMRPLDVVSPTGVAATTQLKRGKTKYGAMMGQNVQGPHTIAHTTIAAIESMANLDPVARFDTYKKLKIILSVAEVKALVKKDQTAGDPAWLTARYDQYIAWYKEYLRRCEAWHKAVGKSKPGTDKYYDALHELDLAVTDIRDMHPASTYGGDLEYGASLAMLAGKGERKESSVIKAISSLKPGDDKGLQEQIMQDADVDDLTSVGDVHDLRDAYARLAAGAMKWK